MKSIRVATFALLGLGLTVVAVTASADPPPLPQEGFDACSAKKDGEACSATFRGQEIKGTCGAVPGTDKLFCRPSGPPLPMVEACQGKKESDACAVALPGHTFEGACRKGPSGELICAPR